MTETKLSLSAESMPARVPVAAPVSCSPALLPSMPRLPLPLNLGTTGLPHPNEETLADAISYIESHCDWDALFKGGLKTSVTGIGWSVSLIRARKSGQSVNRRELNLANIRRAARLAQTRVRRRPALSRRWEAAHA